jgi:hypothetical protein
MTTLLSAPEQTRVRYPDEEGYAERDGVRVFWERYGEGEPTILLPPTWEIVHSRFWKGQEGHPFGSEPGTDEGWAKETHGYWLRDWPGYVEFFFSQCFTEPHSTKQIEDSIGWGLETSPEVLITENAAPWVDEATLRGWCAASRRCPALVIHGAEDQISPPRIGKALAQATGGTLVMLEGAGHIPLARDPVKVNRLVREFVASLPPWRRP